MDGLQKVIRNAPKDPRQCPSSSFSKFENPPPRPSEGLSSALSSSEHSRILINRPARYSPPTTLSYPSYFGFNFFHLVLKL